MARDTKAIRGEYAAWLATPPRLRIQLNMPRTDKEFSQVKGVDARTLRRWKELEEFQLLVEQLKVELGHAAPNAAVAAVGGARPATDARTAGKLRPQAVATAADEPALLESSSPEEAEYRRVRATLTSMAENGNQGALDLWLKYYGKAFIAAETEDSDSDLADMTDDELVAEVLELVGEERLAGFLAASIGA